MKNWELCPKCNGEGHVFDGLTTGGKTCNLCNGTMVISVFTGLPPAHAQTKLAATITMASVDSVPFTYTKSH